MVIRRLSAMIKVWRTIFSTSEGTAGERAISRTKKGLKVRVLRDGGDVNNYIVDNITVRESVCETFCLHRLRFLHGCNIDLADFTFGCVKTIRVHAFHPRAARGISQASSAQRTHIACRPFLYSKNIRKRSRCNANVNSENRFVKDLSRLRDAHDVLASPLHPRKARMKQTTRIPLPKSSGKLSRSAL